MPLDTKHTTWPKVCGQLDEVRALQDSQVPSLPSFKSEKRSSSTTTSEEDDTVNIPLFHQSDSLCVYKLLQIKYQSLQTTNSCYNSSCDINLIRGEMTFFFIKSVELSENTSSDEDQTNCVCVCVYIHMQILKMRLKWVKLDSCDSAFS